MSDLLRDLTSDGYCRAEGVLPATMLQELRRATNALCAGQSDEHAARYRAQGSMFAVGDSEDPVFGRLIA